MILQWLLAFFSCNHKGPKVRVGHVDGGSHIMCGLCGERL